MTTAPNDLWTTDFKGHFRTRDGLYCYPLTIADLHTRYLLACHGLLSTKGVGVRPVFDRLFREYGLPRAIRTDNGVPFATSASTASRSSTSGGCGSASSISASARPRPTRTARMSGCTRPSKPRPRGRRARRRGPAPRLHRLSPPLQRRAPARGARRPHASGALPRLTPRVPRRLPPVEYPGHFIVKRVTTLATSSSRSACCSSPMRSRNIPSGSTKSTTASGRFTSATCASGTSTNATASSARTRQCHPCSRFVLLPMFPVAHAFTAAANRTRAPESVDLSRVV